MRSALPFLALACAAASAHAEPGAVSSVSGPGVSQGETRIEARIAAFDGGSLDDRWQYRAQSQPRFHRYLASHADPARHAASR